MCERFGRGFVHAQVLGVHPLMGLLATIVRELVTAGVTGDDLVTAIERIEEEIAKEDDRSAPPPRSAGAIRQARHRLKKASQSVTNITRDVTRNAGIYIEDNNTIDNTNIDMPTVTRDVTRNALPEPARKRPSKSPFPEGWTPDDLSPEDSSEFERFRDHALKNDSRYARWDAAWRNWKTSPFRKAGGGVNGSNREIGNAGGSFATIAARLRAADRSRHGPPGDFESSG